MYQFELCDYSNPTHCEALIELMEEYMADPMGDHAPHTDKENEQLITGLANHHGAFVVFVLDGDKYVGFTTCFELFSTFSVRPYMYIHDFAIAASHRGKGVGRAMMAHLVELSNKKGCAKITLEVRVDNPSALKLYKNFGFESCEPDMLFWTKKL